VTEDVQFGLDEWGFTEEECRRLHRFPVTQCGLFRNMPVIRGAAPAIRRLANEGVRVRAVTHRLFIDSSTGPRSSRPCSGVEDAPRTIALLQEDGKKVISFTTSTKATRFTRSSAPTTGPR